MTWADLGEFIKAVARVFTAGAACFAAWIAYKGLTRWQTEVLGRRRMELAEDVLSNLYEAKRLITVIRFPFATEGESAARVAPPGETDEQKRLRDSYFAPLGRYEHHMKFFSDLRAKRYRMMALFGPKVAEPFDEIEQTLSKIIAAARMLLRTAGDEIRDVEFHRKLEATIWQAEENDEHATKVDKAVTDIEAICRPVLEKRAA